MNQPPGWGPNRGPAGVQGAAQPSYGPQQQGYPQQQQQQPDDSYGASEAHDEESWTKSIVAAVVEGRGFASPRKMGTGFLSMSAVALVANIVVVYVMSSYFIWLAVMPGLLLPAGAWLLVTNAPRLDPSNQPAPMWARAGLLGSLLAGLPLAWFFLRFFHGG